jgi:DUF1680 family protein
VALEPGSFATLRRTWKDGDRIEVEFEIPMRLEAVDAQHPDLVALMHGPVALFAMRDAASTEGLTRADLLKAQPNASGIEWRLRTDRGEQRWKPFTAIQNEPYQLYQQVKA